MGSDILSFRGRHVVARDSVFELLRHFALLEFAECTAEDLQCDGATRCALDAYFRGWDCICPGVVLGIELDPVLAEHVSRLAPLRLLLSRVRDRIGRFGDVIPLAYLERHLNNRDSYYRGDTPSRFVLELIDGMRALLDDGAV